MVALLVALVLISNKTTILGRAPLPLPPDALAFKAREMLKQFGYAEEPVDSAYGFYPSPAFSSYPLYVRAHDFDRRWERIASHRPALTWFWYRQHQDYLQPRSFLSLLGRNDALIRGLVTPFDPPFTAQGMVRIILDPQGRLDSLTAMPSPALSQAPAGRVVDLGSLLTSAGLDEARFTPSPPEAFLPVYADSRMAWTGTYEEGRPDTIRVEAATLNGRPVFFKIQGPWDTPEIAATPPGQRFVQILAGILFMALVVATALVARRNVRLGRGDTKAAWRIAAAIFAALVASWALLASHVPTGWEFYLLLMGLSWAALLGGLVAMQYLAIEPYVRRNWPDALISWVRIVGGRFRDPLVASHVLAGVVAGLVLALLGAVTTLAMKDVRIDSQQASTVSLSGARFVFGLLLDFVNAASETATAFILVLVLLRSVIRRTWVADGLFVVLVSAGSLTSPATMPVAVLTAATEIWILRRFGLLAFVALITAGLATRLPSTVASWYAALSLTTPLILAAVAAWSLYVILTARPGSASRPASESPV